MAASFTYEDPCKTGLVVVVRKFKVQDEDLGGDPDVRRKGNEETAILSAITQQVVNPGPYKMIGSTLDWDEVLHGERTVVLKMNRANTWGHEYDVKIPCKNPGCRRPVEVSFDIREFPTKPLPSTSMDHVIKGTPLVTTLPSCGAKVSFRLPRGKDQRALKNLLKQNQREFMSSYLRFRTVAVDGVKEPDLQAWFKNLDADDEAFLHHQMEEADCGVNSEGTFACLECNHEWTEDVKLGEGFLFPKYKPKKNASKT